MKYSKKFLKVTIISHSRFFGYFVAVVPVHHCAKIHSLSSSNKLSTEMRVLDLADFLAHLSVFERMKVCAFISRKLNKLRGPFFTFPDNFTPSILIAKNIPPGVKVRGLQRPQIGLRSQNFKIVNFSCCSWPCHSGNKLHMSINLASSVAPVL